MRPTFYYLRSRFIDIFFLKNVGHQQLSVFMTFHIDNLEFNKEYNFNVTVEYKGDNFAGQLSLSNKILTLRVSGERGEESREALPWENIECIRCRDLNSTIFLFDLRPNSGFSRIIGHRPFRAYFENIYEIGRAVFSKSPLRQDQKFQAIKIHSSTISKWIGNTKKQEQIVELYHSKRIINSDKDCFSEFSCRIPGKGQMDLTYNPKLYSNSPEFKAGITFNPAMLFSFDSAAGIEEAINTSTNVIAFFTFITGGYVDVEKVELVLSRPTFSNNATLYFPRPVPSRIKERYMFFPLGRDLRFDSLGLPEFPLRSITSFFTQDAKSAKFFSQYLKYKELKSEEERFLGFFRLLEAIAYKEGRYLNEDSLREVLDRAKPYLIQKLGDKKSVTSFLNRIPRWNSTKYNAQKCLTDLFCEIYSNVSDDWKYGKDEIGAICKLRNDITHANDYEASSTTVAGFTLFLELLVVYSLLIKIDVPASTAGKILCRFNRYQEILRHST